MTVTFISLTAGLMYRYKVRYAMDLLKRNFYYSKTTSTSGCSVVAGQVGALWYFLREHHRCYMEIIISNRELWSSLLAVTFLTNTLPNCYLVTRLVLDMKSLTNIEVVSMTVTLASQCAAFAFSLAPCGVYSAAFHSPKRILVGIQLQVSSTSASARVSSNHQMLLYKLKLDDLYLRLTSGRKYGVSIGFLGVITYTYLFEV